MGLGEFRAGVYAAVPPATSMSAMSRVTSPVISKLRIDGLSPSNKPFLFLFIDW